MENIDLLENEIIEGYGCKLISINSKIDFSMKQIAREPTYLIYPNAPHNLVIQYREGIKAVVDENNLVKQINFDLQSGYVFHKKITPRETSLRIIRKHHWSYEHLYPGLISSEFYKGVGFALNLNMKNYWEHRFECTSLERLIEIDDFVIGEIIVFSNFIDGKTPFEMYEAFIWDEKISTLRKQLPQDEK